MLKVVVDSRMQVNEEEAKQVGTSGKRKEERKGLLFQKTKECNCSFIKQPASTKPNVTFSKLFLRLLSTNASQAVLLLMTSRCLVLRPERFRDFVLIVLVIKAC
jgi:hypothetical protein